LYLPLLSVRYCRSKNKKKILEDKAIGGRV